MSPSTLYRAAATTGMACSVLLLTNAARRADLLPENALTHAIAPLASLAGLFALTGIYLWQHAAANRLGLLGYALNAAGLAGAFAIEYTAHFTFAHLDDDLVDSLVDGATGTAFIVTSVVLIIGVLAFAAASWRTGQFPAIAIGLYAAGLTLVGLNTLLPDAVYLAGIAVTAAAIAWLSVTLFTAATAAARTRPAIL